MRAAIERPLAATERPQLDQSLKAMADSGDVPALVGLFEAFLHAADAIIGFLNRPALCDHEGAGELLTTEHERLFDLAEAVIYELAQPETIAATLAKASALPAGMPN